MIPRAVIWCNHPNHKSPGWTEVNERWVGNERVDREDHVAEDIKVHCEKYGDDHRRFVVMGDKVYKEDFG